DALDEDVSAPDSDAFKDFRRPSGFPFVRLRGPVAIVALSTAHVSPPLLATGSLGSRQIAAAEELLMHPEVRRRFRLVVMHHPPRSPYATWQKRLKDADAFNAMIGRVGAEMIVHGHLHRDLNEEVAGPDAPVPVVGANSSIWLTDDVARRASYGIYEIDDDGHFAGMERRAYDSDTERYV
ncbi:MAG: metallophosphoesterase, partial [Deltaproteobacteria bacterium]|nr:metallophosphoesterase [Deltaproteobacteria bacterium]